MAPQRSPQNPASNLQAQLLAALNCAGDAIEITDSEGCLLYVNKAFESQTGFSRHEVLGKTPGELLRSGYHSDLYYESIWAAISQGRQWGGEIYRRRKDTTIIHVEVKISPVLNGAGEVTHYIAVSRDISERKAAEEERARFEQQLQHSHRLESIGRLAGGVAHDFNNILTGIMGYVELMMGDPDGFDEEDLHEILRAARRGSELTRQLLAFSRKQTIVPRCINANDSLVMSQRLLERILGEDIALELDCDTSLWNILADPGQLEQVLMNLAANARDAMPTGGLLSLSSSNIVVDEGLRLQYPYMVPGQFVCLRIEDTGHGMDEALQHRIFEPFFSTRDMGTGLGLATVYGIVKQNKGFINVMSSLGQGTRFDIFLPRHLDELDEASEAEEAIARGNETVLIVEDEAMIRRLMQRVLEQRGYKVLSAGDGQSAIELVESVEEAIHLGIFDIVMPGMNGHELSERLAASYPGLKVLYMSGYTPDAIAERGLNNLEVNFISKPFTTRGLLDKVRTILDT